MKQMNYYVVALLMNVVLLGFSACGSDDVLGEKQPTQKDEAKVYFVYTLDTSSGTPMSHVRAKAAKTNQEVFDEFYTKIKSGDLVAPTYELTLTEVNTGTVYTFRGQWNRHDLITLNTGTYHVVGKTTAEGDNIQEKCSFIFDEVCNIDITSSVVTLHATYDSFLLIFNNSDIQSLQNYNGSSLSSFFTFGTSYKYAFVKDQLYVSDKKSEAYILGKYTDGAEFKVFTGNLDFEKGKYYVYNSVSNSFDVPPMEEGNVTNREIEGFGRVANAIDLGLSVKWASWNVGASKIGDYGGLYGAADPTGLKTSTSYSDYYYKNGTNICGTEYDLASVKWQGAWRLPTMTELKELKEKCTWTFNVTIDGVLGATATGPNGNSIFIPYAGIRIGTSVSYKNDHASLWSGECGASPYSHGYKDLDVNYTTKGGFQMDGSENYTGQSIRPVCGY